MEAEIINRVAKSSLQIFDLEDYFPQEKQIGIDLSPWLWEGFILREKEFRLTLQNHDWSQYEDFYVYLFCATDAIIPSWAFSLVTMKLAPYSKKVIVGSEQDLNNILYIEILEKIDFSPYKDKAVLLKGCSEKSVPANAFVLACQKLYAVAKSVMYGEACSTVPLYKNVKK